MATDGVLWRSGWLVLAVGLVCALAMLFDGRLVNGLNTWTKSVKFGFSVGLFLLTLGVLLPFIEMPLALRTTLAWGLPLTIGVAFGLIVMQSARGVASHFNVGTPFDGAVFGAMGISISLNALLLSILLLASFSGTGHLPEALRWGIRLGLVCALLGSLQGFVMVQRMAHTVGAPDGGPGLPVLNFSTIAGDLRIAHALLLHGLQLLPLAGWWLARQQVPRGWLLVVLLFMAVLGMAALVFLQALSGKPLLALSDNHAHASSARTIGAGRL